MGKVSAVSSASAKSRAEFHRCCRCGMPLGKDDVKVVISSKARGGMNLPVSSRLVCGDCFLGAAHAAPARAQGRGGTREYAILNK